MAENEIIQALKNKAAKIPSMGGKELGPRFSHYIAELPDGANVVEVGSWLGAGTAQIALAMIEHEKFNSALHVYDRWHSTSTEVKKARKQGVKIAPHVNTLPLVKAFLKPFSSRITIKYHRGEIRQIEYKGNPIGVFVIDAGKREDAFRAVMNCIEPNLIDGAIVFFMDYYYYLHKDDPRLICQKIIIEASGHYTELEKFEDLSCSIQRYAK